MCFRFKRNYINNKITLKISLKTHGQEKKEKLFRLEPLSLFIPRLIRAWIKSKMYSITLGGVWFLIYFFKFDFNINLSKSYIIFRFSPVNLILIFRFSFFQFRFFLSIHTVSGSKSHEISHKNIPLNLL